LINAQAIIIDYIEGRRRSILINCTLRLMSFFYKMGVKSKNFIFDYRFIESKTVSIPVVSVGNIVAGGTGKTSFIQKITKDLSQNAQISILSRGYRSKIEKLKGNLHLVNKSRVTPDVCGDEPYLLSKNLPQANLFVGRDRTLNAKRAVYHNAELILLDDGMQYRYLNRDLEVVMLNSNNLFGHGFFLPRGYLRDSPSRLKKADYIVVNHVQDKDHFEKLKSRIIKFTKAPIIGTRMAPKHVSTFLGNKLVDLKGYRVGVFCGLGDPQSFLATLENMGCKVINELILQDHIAPSYKELLSFSNKCISDKCDIIICSQKDWIKAPIGHDLPIEVGFLEAELDVLGGMSHYEEMLSYVRKLVEKNKVRIND